MRMLAVLLVVAGCHGGGGSATPDGGHGNGTDSGIGGSPGLFVAWDDNPHLPGAVTSDINVTSVMFEIRNFQVLADAGNTSHPNYLLTWSAVSRPVQEAFPSAPAGVYSKVSIEFGGALVAYTLQITGTVHLSGGGGGGGPGPHVVTPDGPGPGGGGGGGSDDNQPFTIIDHKPFMVSITCDEELEANAPKSFGVRLDLSNTLSGINFANLTKDGSGTLILDENSAEYAGFHTRLSTAFTIQD